MENESLPAENETEKLKKEGKIQKLKCYLVALSNVINSERTRCCLIVSFIIFSRPHRLTDGHDLDKNVNLWERARCSKRTGYVQM